MINVGDLVKWKLKYTKGKGKVIRIKLKNCIIVDKKGREHIIFNEDYGKIKIIKYYNKNHLLKW